jgi:hypothetical protein
MNILSKNQLFRFLLKEKQNRKPKKKSYPFSKSNKTTHPLNKSKGLWLMGHIKREREREREREDLLSRKLDLDLVWYRRGGAWVAFNGQALDLELVWWVGITEGVGKAPNRLQHG